MGGKSSKGSLQTNVKKDVPVPKRSGKRKSRNDHDSDSDLDEEDCNLVTVPLDVSVTDRRLSKAKELIASGRPISISLEATAEEPTSISQRGGTWEDEKARENWRGQLDLMRHFYDWDEIPMDFFIDYYVGGDNVRKRRLSLNLVTEPPVEKPVPTATVVPDRTVTRIPVPSPNRHRAASVDVGSSRYQHQPQQQNNPNGRPVPMAMARPAVEAIPENNIAKEPNKKVPPTLPERPVQQKTDKPNETPASIAISVTPNRGAGRTRAASVAIGEAFPLPQAAAIQKQAAAAPSRSAAAKGPVANKIVSQTKDVEGRPRRASATSIDEVYGRLGRPGGAYDRFEVENPVLQSNSKSPQAKERRPTITDNKKPEQFKNLTTVIDPTQFANERRTRVSVRKSTVEKPLFDDGRPSTASTMLESKSSNSNSRSRTMSDWL